MVKFTDLPSEIIHIIATLLPTNKDRLYLALTCTTIKYSVYGYDTTLSAIDPSVNNNIAIMRASAYGYADIVKILLLDSRVDPRVGNNFSIYYASANGHTNVVKLLLSTSRIDVSAKNASLQSATCYGHIDIVKLLLSDHEVDPSDNNNYALDQSLLRGYSDIFKLLTKHGCTFFRYK